MLKSRLLARILILCLLLSSPFVLAMQEKENTWIEISVSGVDPALTNNIFAHLGQLPDSDVQRRSYLFTINDNVNAALESLGYFHGNIQKDIQQPNKGPWKVKLTIKAGPPVHVQWIDIRLDGEMRDDPKFESWLHNVKIKPGDVLNQGVYEQVKSQLLSLALARGYFDGKYTESRITINRDLNNATISLHFNSGPRFRIGEVTFDGSDLASSLLHTLVPFNYNTPYNTRHLGDLNRDLLDTGYFSNIKVIPLIDDIKEGLVPIKVQLTPKPKNSIDLGLGVDIGNSIDNNFEPRVRVTWRTPQINSLGHSQETSVEWSPDRPKFLTTYTIPLTHPLNDKLQIKVGLLRDKYGVTQVYNKTDRDYENTGQMDSTKGLIEVIRQQKLKHDWLLGYSVQAIQESYTQSDIDHNPTFILFGSGLQKTVRGDNSLDPKSGYRESYSVQYADPNLGSAARLARFQGKFIWIDTFFEKHRIVSRLDLGVNIADKDKLADIPPSLRYFAGGDQSIRGYGYQELGPFIEYETADGNRGRQIVGGRFLMVGSLEYQYYFLPTWRVAAFVDVGNAFDQNQFNPIIAIGPGIHWISPVGPIKLDVGFGLNSSTIQDKQWRIHITMGSEL